MTFRIAPAAGAADIAAARALFRDYLDRLGIDLSFQDVEAELADLPGRYAPPRGTLLLARDLAGKAVGCVALRPLGKGDCEIKRLYVAPEAQGAGLGRRLAEAVLAEARAAGHRRVLLDTLATMTPALGLYRSLGFADIPPYYANPLPGTVYLALSLAPDPAPVRADARGPSGPP